MGEKTAISWCDSTFNPWIGCTKVSPGCQHCYAEIGPAAKFKGVKWGAGQPRLRTSESNWNLPLRYNRKAAASGERHLVFCASLADWLDPEVPVEWLADLLGLIAATPALTWQLLTKRPELWRERMAIVVRLSGGDVRGYGFAGRKVALDWLDGNAPANVWIGTTVEDQRRADERIPALLSIPARVRFLSCEPLLEAVDLESIVEPRASPGVLNSLTGWWWPAVGDADAEDRGKIQGECISWTIVGGESGTKARPFNLGWARAIVKQCKAAGVAVFVKQMGDLPVDTVEGGDYPGRHRLTFTAHHGADPSEWPEDLRVQEFPQQ